MACGPGHSLTKPFVGDDSLRATPPGIWLGCSLHRLKSTDHQPLLTNTPGVPRSPGPALRLKLIMGTIAVPPEAGTVPGQCRSHREQPHWENLI